MKKPLTGIAALLGIVALLPLTAGASPQDLYEQQSGAPRVRITSPASGDVLTPGEGVPGRGSFNGSGFALTFKVETHDAVGFHVKEALNIRHTELLDFPNPDFPGLSVTMDNNLTKPDGGVIPAGTNLAALFNIAGTDDTPGPGVTVWAGWHVLESLAPGTRRVTVRVAVTDDARRTGATVRTFRVSDASGPSAQALTPAPGSVGGDNNDDADGPAVSINAPLAPTSVALGTLPQPTPTNGTLFFLQVDAKDVARHGIGVSENGFRASDAAATGLIVDPMQIGARGPNRNYPGLNVTFDVALRQPNGNLIPAGQNLAPLFNIAGSQLSRPGKVSKTDTSSDDTTSGADDDISRAVVVNTVADWVIGGSLVLPVGKTSVTITARVTDNAGRSGSDTITVGVSPATSGQDLTAAP